MDAAAVIYVARPNARDLSKWFRRFSSRENIVVLIPVLLFVILVARDGPPALRHDWIWISNRDEFVQNAWLSLVWKPTGIGGARPYPTDYPLAMFNALVAAVFGTSVAFIVFVAAIAIWCASSAAAFASGGNPVVRGALATFVLFNPWTYTEMVAGHVAMIVAAGAVIRLMTEIIVHSGKRTSAIALAAATACVQLQFLLPTACAIAIWAFCRRRLIPILVVCLVAAPTFVGIAAHLREVASTPLNLAWEADQSVSPIDLIGLTGYFARYTAKFSIVTISAVWVFAAIGVFGFLIERDIGRRVLGFIATLIAMVWAAGTKSPFAPSFNWAFANLPFMGVYRELYDVLAICVATYLSFSAIAMNRSKTIAIIGALCGAVLAIAWIMDPVTAWWVPSREIPPVSVTAVHQTRLALYPAVGPLTSTYGGSGLDPDAFVHTGDISTLNSLDSAYPSVTALLKFDRTGDETDLRALTVSQILNRNWLHVDLGSLRGQLALPVAIMSSLSRQSVQNIADFTPLIGTVQTIAISRTVPRLGSGEVFYADLPRREGVAYGTFEPISPPMGFLSSSAGWVDVRNAFVTSPELGEPFGGAITTNPTALLPVNGARNALVWVRGRLNDSRGNVIIGSTGGYVWVGLNSSVMALRCWGRCVVVGTGVPPPGLANHCGRRKSAVKPVQFDQLLPWLVRVRLPKADKGTMVRYSTAFDPYFLAITAHGVLVHVRIEGVFNGWIMPANDSSSSILLLEPITAIQFILEVIGAAAMVFLILSLDRNRAPVETV